PAVEFAVALGPERAGPLVPARALALPLALRDSTISRVRRNSSRMPVNKDKTSAPPAAPAPATLAGPLGCVFSLSEQKDKKFQLFILRFSVNVKRCFIHL